MFGLACEHAWCNLLLLLKILFSFPMTGMHWSWCLVKGKKQQSADSVFFCTWYTKSSTTQTSTYGLWHSSRYTGNNEVSVKASFVPVTSINMLGEVAETHSVKIKTVSEVVFYSMLTVIWKIGCTYEHRTGVVFVKVLQQCSKTEIFINNPMEILVLTVTK